MKIHGWEKNDKGYHTKSHNLGEVSFACTVEDFDKIFCFIKYVKNCIENRGECIEQYRDWDKTWRKGDPDIVISIQSDLGKDK